MLKTGLDDLLQRLLRAKKVKAVSFDIFDTAISRTFAEPHDLFLLVEQRTVDASGVKRSFAYARQEAEKIARQRAGRCEACQEITLDEIYKVLAEFDFSDAECELYKDEEIKTELCHTYSVPAIQKIYKQLRDLNVPVVFTSDFYIPSQMVRQILESCGYDFWSHLFVSCEIGKTKESGDLFKHVESTLEEAGVIVSANQILHIGDNPYSDIKQARKAGFRTFYVGRPVDNFRKNGLGQWPLFGQFDSFKQGPRQLERSTVLGLFVRDWLREGGHPDEALSLRDIGFRVVGPMLYGFAKWLHEQCEQEGHSKLFFLARDGLIFKKAFDLLSPTFGLRVKSEYIYASRRALHFPAITELDSGAMEFLTRTWVYIPASEFITRLGLDLDVFRTDVEAVFGGIDVLASPRNERAKALFQRICSRLMPVIEAERAGATAYLDRKGLFSGKAAVCDIGYRGSMQAAIARLAELSGKESALHGYYFATNRFPIWNYLITKGWAYDNDKPEENFRALQHSIPLIELFFTAQHGTVLKILSDANDADRRGDEAVLEIPSADEMERFAVSEEIQSGALSFIQDVIDRGLAPFLNAEPDFALTGWNSLVQSPSKPVLRLFLKVKHNDGPGVSSFKPMLEPLTLGRLIFRPRSALRAFWTNQWRAGSLAGSSKAARMMRVLVERLHGHYKKFRTGILR